MFQKEYKEACNHLFPSGFRAQYTDVLFATDFLLIHLGNPEACRDIMLDHPAAVWLLASWHSKALSSLLSPLIPILLETIRDPWGLYQRIWDLPLVSGLLLIDQAKKLLAQDPSYSEDISAVLVDLSKKHEAWGLNEMLNINAALQMPEEKLVSSDIKLLCQSDVDVI